MFGSRAIKWYCPGTRNRHVYDAETHRCKCGRYERGYTPKKEPSKPRAECQICEGTFACDKDSTLCHHGYKRPGRGYIVGDCMGEGHRPYPATDALEKWLTVVCNAIEAKEELHNRTKRVRTITFHYYDRTKPEKGITRYGPNASIEVQHGYMGGYVDGVRVLVPSFDDLKKRELANIASEIKFWKGEKTRVESRIEKAKRSSSFEKEISSCLP